jgi:hypothetical protein
MSEQEIRPGGDLDVLHYYVGWRVVVTLRDGEVHRGRIAQLSSTEMEISSVRPDLGLGRYPLRFEDIDRISVRHEPYVPPTKRRRRRKPKPMT